MDEIDVAVTDWVTTVVAALAFLLSAVALFYSRRATGAAVRSADASEQSAEASARSATVAESAEQRTQQDAEDRSVRWEISSYPVNESPASLEHLPEAVRLSRIAHPERFWLAVTNFGEATAYDVKTLVAGKPGSSAESVAPGRSLRSEVPWHWVGQVVVQVQWRSRPDGRLLTWTGRRRPAGPQ